MRTALLSLAATVLVASLSQAAAPTFRRHVLRIAEMGQDNWSSQPQWVDLDGDGLRDAVGVLPDGNVYLCYQRKDGFGERPDQVLRVPPDTAWVTACDVSKDPGLEIVVSTGRGWSYYPRRNGVFAAEPVPLLSSRQIYAEGSVPRPFISDRGFPGQDGEMPALFEDHALVYKLRTGEPPASGQSVPLKIKSTLRDEAHWRIATGDWRHPTWSLGNTENSWLFVGRTASDARQAEDRKPDKDAVDRFYEALRKNHERRRSYRILRQDLNGDGKPDALLWQTRWGLDEETTFYVFLADAQGHFNDKPDQTLRTGGLPVGWSPLIDVTGDNRPELLTVEPRNVSISLSFAAEVLASGRIDARISFRSFDGKAFTRRPAFQLDVSMTITRSMENIMAPGDFNGDGRADLLAWRSPTQADIYLSRTSGDLYERQPSLHFEAPAFAEPDAVDLNGDKIADVVFVSFDSDEFVIYLSNPAVKEGPAR